MERQDFQHGRPEMAKISSFKIAAGIFGTAAPQNQWLSVEALRSKVEPLGYKVQKAKLKNACGELYTLDKNGSRVELFVDPTNGQIAGQL
jgi:hypothetical protein